MLPLLREITMSRRTAIITWTLAYIALAVALVWVAMAVGLPDIFEAALIGTKGR